LIHDADASYWVLAVLLVVAWLALWVVRHQVRWWFFAIGFGLSVLCFPGGSIAGNIELGGDGCPRGGAPVMCVPHANVVVWANGLLGLWTCLVLLAVTLLLRLLRFLVRRGHGNARAEDAGHGAAAGQ
jgi:hypothetical protein